MTGYPYVSGWCGTGTHLSCTGSYAGVACRCRCHRPARTTPPGMVQPSLFTPTPASTPARPGQSRKDTV